MKTRPRIHKFLLIVVICLVLGPVQLRAQVDEEEVAATRDTAWLTIEASSGKGTSVDLVLPSKVSDPQRLENALNKSFSFALNLKRRSSADFEGQEFEEDQEGEDLPFEWTSFAGRNDKAFVREGLQSTCHIDFAPLLEALKAEHIEHLKFGLVLINTHEHLSVEGLKNISSQHGLSYFRKDITVRAPELIGFDLSSGYSTRQVLNSVSMIVLFTALPGLCLLGMNLWNR